MKMFHSRQFKSKIKQLLLYHNHILRWKIGHYKSYINRKQVIADYIDTHNVTKLQLGCGPHRLKGWLNTDLYGSAELVSLNLLKKFPIENNSFDHVYSEHVIEHFSFKEAEDMYREIFRIMRPGGVLRIATPNLEFLINLYKKNKTNVQKKYIKWSSDEFFKELENKDEVFVINNFVRAWGHKFIYDFKSLEILLTRAGFINIKELRPGKSKHRHLRNIECHWKDISHAFNNLETIVVEAQKPA